MISEIRLRSSFWLGWTPGIFDDLPVNRPTDRPTVVRAVAGTPSL